MNRDLLPVPDVRIRLVVVAVLWGLALFLNSSWLAALVSMVLAVGTWRQFRISPKSIKHRWTVCFFALPHRGWNVKRSQKTFQFLGPAKENRQQELLIPFLLPASTLKLPRTVLQDLVHLFSGQDAGFSICIRNEKSLALFHFLVRPIVHTTTPSSRRACILNCSVIDSVCHYPKKSFLIHPIQRSEPPALRLVLLQEQVGHLPITAIHSVAGIVPWSLPGNSEPRHVATDPDPKKSHSPFSPRPA